MGFILYLFWWGGHCCPMHYDLFKIYCAPMNLGITRTWICRLNFGQRPIFSGLRCFNEPEISYSGPPPLSSSRRTCAQDFYILKKSINLSRDWTREPWISKRAHYPKTTETSSVHGYKYLPDVIQCLEEEDMKQKEQWKKLMSVRDSLDGFAIDNSN